ncbi:MAG: cytochrome c [Acidobacteriota bacterium]|nr:cytochrome c [Acidobacteriota bacterium]
MKLVKLFIVATAVALFAIACGNSDSTNQTATSNTTTQPTASPKPTASATPQDELADAKKSYAQVCANCHGDHGEGGPVKIEGKTLKVPSLKEGHALKHSDEEFVKQITKGGGGMPPFKDKLTPEQINNIVKYLRRDIQGSAAPKAGD